MCDRKKRERDEGNELTSLRGAATRPFLTTGPVKQLQKNQGTSLVEVMTAEEIVTHLAGLTLGAPPAAIPKVPLTRDY